MSAITGIFMRNGKDVDPELMKKMNEKLSHRGPDGSAIWCDGPMGLGHQMLWTTQESLHEKLPLEENGLVITADARIDNRDELSKELGLRDEEDVSDSYFILKAYEMWGDDCPDKLLGDFAFAIWDTEKEKLFCARDHMGVKPFYYYLDDDMFVFGTEIKALFCVDGVPRKLNERKVAFYLMDIDDNKSTFYKNVFSFSAAHFIKIQKNTAKTKQYWKLDPKYNNIMESDEEYANIFREIFTKAVNCRLRSAFPIGFELSGGLDSSSVVCMAKNILNNEINSNKISTFSFIFNDFPESNEHYYIKKITNNEGIDSTLIYGDKINLLEDIEYKLWYQEQPFFTPFIELLWNLYQKMQESNRRVILSGLGGDSVVSYGSHYFRDLAISFKWDKLFNEIHNNSKITNTGLFELFVYNVFFPIIPDFFKRIISNNKQKMDILNSDFAKKINAEEYLEKIYLKPIKESKTAKKHHHHIISTDNIYMLEMLDRSTSVFSLEPRYPFLDKRLVEFCYSIPTEMKFKFGWNRYIQRIAMKDILPAANQWRPLKAGLEPVYDKNLLLFEKNRLDTILCSNNKIIAEYVDINKVKNIYKKFKQGTAGYDSFKIWFISLLFLWLKESKISK